MFDTLSDKLQSVLGDLRSRGTLDEDAISKAMREIRLALLEADVNLQVVKEFVARVRERAVGEEVTKSLTPGQQVVKIVHEELTATMGGGDSRLAFASRGETAIVLAGLQGSGKTTAAAKLALMLRKEGKTPALVAADLQRPAAIDQLEQLGRQIQVPVFGEERKDPIAAARQGIDWAVGQGADVVIVDTAGRLHTQDDLMAELTKVRRVIQKQMPDAPHETLMTVDATTGQNGVRQAKLFGEAVDVTGVILTKLDGTAKGGIALAIANELGIPVKLIGLGEQLEDLRPFDADDFARALLT